jgi:1-acyl-sn-glycerol-3-phosphate acyltransferase
MKVLRAFFRSILLLIATLLLIIPILVFYFLKGKSNPVSFYFRQLWIRISLFILGVKVKVEGLQNGYPPSLFVGNHWSYFDPVATLHLIIADPVAKSEVRKWPLIGEGAEATGVLFVKREDPDSRKEVRQQLVQNIKNGRSVLIYPEGTTSSNRYTLPFKKGGFEMAARYHIPVVPIAIWYEDVNDAWVGDDTFVPHFFRNFGKRYTHIHLCFGPPLQAMDGQHVLEEAQRWINDQLSIRNPTG